MRLHHATPFSLIKERKEGKKITRCIVNPGNKIEIDRDKANNPKPLHFVSALKRRKERELKKKNEKNIYVYIYIILRLALSIL